MRRMIVAAAAVGLADGGGLRGTSPLTFEEAWLEQSSPRGSSPQGRLGKKNGVDMSLVCVCFLTVAPKPSSVYAPTLEPSRGATELPTGGPSAALPAPSVLPTVYAPTPSPTTAEPTAAPTTADPTFSPTRDPTTAAPSAEPTLRPSNTAPMTNAPTSNAGAPTPAPTANACDCPSGTIGIPIARR